MRYLFGMQTSSEYNIWQGSNLVAVTNRIGSLSTNPQLVFRKPGAQSSFASGRLNTRHYQLTNWDEWQVVPNKHHVGAVPAYVVNSIVALFAFHEAADIPKGKDTFPSLLLAAWARATAGVRSFAGADTIW